MNDFSIKIQQNRLDGVIWGVGGRSEGPWLRWMIMVYGREGGDGWGQL